MSLLNVNKVDPATGTGLEIGTSGDTITVPSGVTLDIASGATLDTTGATVTGVPYTYTKIEAKTIVDTQTTTVSFTNCFSSTYRSYFIHVPRVSSRTDGDQIKARLISASGDETVGYQWAINGYSSGGNEDRANSDSANHWLVMDASDSSSSGSHMANFTGWICNPNTTNTSYVQASITGSFRNDSDNEWVTFTNAMNNTQNTAYTGIKFYIDASSFQNFVGTIYGVNL